MVENCDPPIGSVPSPVVAVPKPAASKPKVFHKPLAAALKPIDADAVPILAPPKPKAVHHLNKKYVPVRMPEGEVVGVYGNAVVRPLHGKIHPLKVGEFVNRGDVILTAQNGIVEIRHGDRVARITCANDGPLEFDAPGAGPGGTADGGLQPGSYVDRAIEVIEPNGFFDHLPPGGGLLPLVPGVIISTLPFLPDTVPAPPAPTPPTAPPPGPAPEPPAPPAPEPPAPEPPAPPPPPAGKQAVVQISGPSDVVEGQVAPGYVVTLDQPALTDCIVELAYSGVAKDGSDFTGVASVVIKAGETSASFDIATLDDCYAEGDEPFTVTITGTSGGGFDRLTVDASADRVTTVIHDDSGPLVPPSPEPPPSPPPEPGPEDTALCSIRGPGEVVEGQVASGYSVSLDHVPTSDTTVQLIYTGTATDGSDYTAVTSVLIPAGQSQVDFDITTLLDGLPEGAENIVITIGTISGGGFEAVAADGSADSVTTVILDSDGGPNPSEAVCSISGPADVIEGDTASGYTVRIDQAPASDLTLELRYSGVAIDGSDYAGVTSVTIKAGETSASFDITTIDDAYAEGDEAFTVTLVAPVAGGGFDSLSVDPTADSVSTVIHDDVGPGVPPSPPPSPPPEPGPEDTALCSLSGPGEVREGDLASGYSVTLDHVPVSDVTVELRYSGTATDGSDYLGVLSVVIPAGQTSVSFDINTLVDQLVEGAENFTITLGAISGGGFEAIGAEPGGESVTTVITDATDASAPQVQISGPGEVIEGQVATGYTVTLSQAPDSDVTVTLSYSGTAVDGSDFTGVQAVTIKAGETSASFDIATLDDAYAEGDEPFTVSIAQASGGGFSAIGIVAAASSVTTVIHDDAGPLVPPSPPPAPPPEPGPEDTVLCSLSGPGTVKEGDTATGYTVRLDHVPASDVTVELIYSGTATDGSDYTAVTSVVIPAGQSQVSFDLATLLDGLPEGAENIVITLGAVSGGGFEALAVDPSAGSVTTVITDSTVDPNPNGAVCSISGPVDVTEGDTATGYTVRIDYAPTSDLTLALRYSGVAQDGSDYAGVATVTIKAGETSASFDITTIDDAYAEGDEAFTVSLVAPAPGGGFDSITVDPSAGSVTTVIHDDAGPGVPPAPPPAPPPEPGPEDTAQCSLSGPGEVREGDVASGYTVTLDHVPTTDVTVQLTYAGTAKDGSDFTGVASVVIQAGTTSASFDLRTLADDLVEGAETIVVGLGVITGGGFEAIVADPDAGSVTTAILDATPGTDVVCRLAGPGDVVEGETSTGYSVSVNQASEQDITVTLDYSGVASNGSDFVGTTTVVIPAGQTRVEFDIGTLDDAFDEGREAFTVSLVDVASAGLVPVAIDAAASQVLTVISDDTGPGSPPDPGPQPAGPEDTAVASIFGPAQAREGDTATGYQVTLDKAPLSDVTVQLIYSGTASDGSDFTGTYSVVIPAGQRSVSFDLPILNDNTTEATETMTVTLGSLSGGGFETITADAVHNCVDTTIVDNDAIVSISGPADVVEGQVASGYAVQIDKAPTTDVTVQLSYSGTAADGSDFTGVTSVVIKAGETSGSFDIATLDDAYAELGESFTVTIAGTSGGGFDAVTIDASANSVTTDIADDAGPASPTPDAPAGAEDSAVVSIRGPGEVNEGDTASGYTVTLDKAPASDVTVELTYSGTAADGSDFTAVTSVVIPAGQKSTTFNIDTLGDADLEGSEVFNVALGAISGGGFEAIAADPVANNVNTTIIDLTAPPPPPPANDAIVSISGSGDVVEGQVATGYCVQIDKAPTSDVTVQLSYSGVAQDGSDFTAVTTVVIKAGTTSVGFDIATLDDAYAELGESFTVTVASTTGGDFDTLSINPTANSVTTDIADDAGPASPTPDAPAGAEDSAVVSIRGPGEVNEGDTASGYTVTLDKAPASDVTVELTYSGTAADGSDFTAVTSVVIPAGQKSTTFNIDTLGDADLEGSEVFNVALGAISGGGFEAIAADPVANNVNTTIIDLTAPPPPPPPPPANDAVVSISGPGDVVEGQVATGYCVQIDKAPTTDVTVQLNYSGTAADGSDFTGVTSVVIKAGETSGSFDITTLDDAYAELGESFTVTIASTSGGDFDSVTIDASASSVTTDIADDAGPASPTPDAPAGSEDAVHVSLSGPGSVVEGEVATGYAVTLDKAPASDVLVELKYSGTAADGSDFTGVAQVIVKAGELSASFDLATLGDAAREGAEQIVITLGTIDGGGFEAVEVAPGAGVVMTTIVDATPAPTVAEVWMTGPGAVVEGQVASGYCVQIDKAPTTDVTIQLSYSGVAKDGSDFTGISSVTIKAGQTSAAFEIQTLDDAYAEGNETFTVAITGTAGGGFDTLNVDPVDFAVTTTISDDAGPKGPPGAKAGEEDTAHVSLTGPGSVVEGQVSKGYTVTLDKAPTEAVTVQFAYTGTAKDGSDFKGLASVTIPAGKTSASFDLATTDDRCAEGKEAFTVTVAGVTGGGFEAIATNPAAASVLTTIVDNDGCGVPPPPAPPVGVVAHVGITGVGQVVEGQVAKGYTVTLDETPTSAVTVRFAYSGTASNGADYKGVASVVIAVGQKSATFDLATIDDRCRESSESIKVEVATASGGGFNKVAVDPAHASVVTTIVDNDGCAVPAPAPTPEPVIAHVGIAGVSQVVEGQVAKGYTVTLDKVPTADVTVRFAYSGTASNGADYKGVASVVIAAGKTSATFDLATIDDRCRESSESIKVEVATASGGGFNKVAVDPAHASVVTTIVDNDGCAVPAPAPAPTPVLCKAVLSLSGPDSVTEGNVAEGYKISLSQPAVKDLVVKLVYAGNATEGSDYSRTVDVTIPAGKSTVKFNITTKEDAVAEGQECIQLSLGEVRGGGFDSLTKNPASSSVTTRILDDDSSCAPKVADSDGDHGGLLGSIGSNLAGVISWKLGALGGGEHADADSGHTGLLGGKGLAQIDDDALCLDLRDLVGGGSIGGLEGILGTKEGGETSGATGGSTTCDAGKTITNVEIDLHLGVSGGACGTDTNVVSDLLKTDRHTVDVGGGC